MESHIFLLKTKTEQTQTDWSIKALLFMHRWFDFVFDLKTSIARQNKAERADKKLQRKKWLL